MADQLATASDLNLRVKETVDAATAAFLLECATAVVQEAAGLQRILQVAGDTATLVGLTGSWLDLPQIPATGVTSVTLDGTTLTAGAAGSATSTYRRVGSRLWRGDGWQTYVGEPSEVIVIYTHGYSTGHQRLQLARNTVAALAAGVYSNPDGATQVRIDDYAATYEAMQEALTEPLRAAIAKQYGRRGGFVRIG